MTLAAFATAADLTSYINRPTLDADRADLLLRMASATIRAELHQVINRVEDDTITIAPRGGAVLLLPELPVWAVGDVTEVRNGVETLLTEGLDYRVELGTDNRVGILRRLAHGGIDIVDSDTILTVGPNTVTDFTAHWPIAETTGDAGVIITYDHGYDIPDPDSSAGVDHPLPDIIWTVALRVAARGLTNPVGMRQETIGRYSYTAAGPAEDIGLYLNAGDIDDLAGFFAGQRAGAL